MSENSYELYETACRIIERAELCSGNHSNEPLFKEWKTLIEHFHEHYKGYAERYNKEKTMNELIKAIEDMCLLVDEFEKSDITPNTPLYNFQQGLIANVKRYREKKSKQKEIENESSM
jgi:hypothetical protein